jgi:hypothetical protein
MLLFVIAAVVLATAAGCSREPQTSQLGSEKKIDLSLPAPQGSAPPARQSTERADKQEKSADEEDKQVEPSRASAKPGSPNTAAGEGRTPRKPHTSTNSAEKNRQPRAAVRGAAPAQQRRPVEGASAAPEAPSADAAAIPDHERNNPLHPSYKKNE